MWVSFVKTSFSQSHNGMHVRYGYNEPVLNYDKVKQSMDHSNVHFSWDVFTGLPTPHGIICNAGMSYRKNLKEQMWPLLPEENTDVSLAKYVITGCMFDTQPSATA